MLLLREPVLQRIKARLLELMRDYIDALPAPDPQHPLLSAPRGELLIEGSWSVRLERQGYNVQHTHAMGWLSTAFYVALPKPEQMGTAPALPYRVWPAAGRAELAAQTLLHDPAATRAAGDFPVDAVARHRSI